LLAAVSIPYLKLVRHRLLILFFLDPILRLAVVDGDDIYGVDQVDKMCSVKDRHKEEGKMRG
jgi:hypothetical protein